MDGTAQKRAAAERAALLVDDGMTVGLGTGSTAAFVVDALGRRMGEGLRFVGVPTSEATHRQATSLGIPLATLEEAPDLDLVIDGADEIGPGLALIKGGGGALLREKLVAAASRRMVVIADASKRVDRLGRFPLPVEVVPFGIETTSRRLEGVLHDVLGKPVDMAVRRRPDGSPFVTDGQHWILDAQCGAIPDPAALAAAIKAILGVVDHGLFVALADVALIGTPDEVMEMTADGSTRRGEG